MKDGQIQGILKNQMELLQEACGWELLPDEAARLSEALASAVRVAACLGAAALNNYKAESSEGINQWLYKPRESKP